MSQELGEFFSLFMVFILRDIFLGLCLGNISNRNTSRIHEKVLCGTLFS
jgi:hypothetical protein